MPTPEEIEAGGRKVICVQKFRQGADCTEHDHIPGELLNDDPPVED